MIHTAQLRPSTVPRLAALLPGVGTLDLSSLAPAPSTHKNSGFVEITTIWAGGFMSSLLRNIRPPDPSAPQCRIFLDKFSEVRDVISGILAVPWRIKSAPSLTFIAAATNRHRRLALLDGTGETTLPGSRGSVSQPIVPDGRPRSVSFPVPHRASRTSDLAH